MPAARSSRSSKAAPRVGAVASLALADMRHEWLLNLCIVLALAGILAPLLLLFGLKHGVIEVLRAQLVQDPVYRELKPAQTESLAPDWFARMAERPDVAFVLPTILRGSSIVRARPGDADVASASAESHAFDLIPTAGGDPLFLDTGTPIPGPGEAALSQPAAELLELGVGDPLTVSVSRARGGRTEQAEQTLTVIGILPVKADGLERLYAPLALAVDVEAYREGMAVPERGWPGGTPTPTPRIDGAYVFLDEPLNPVLRQSLVIGTGFLNVARVQPGEVAARLGVTPTDPGAIYEVSVLRNPVPPSSLRNLRAPLRGRGAVIVPFIRDLVVRLGPDTVPAAGLSLSDADAAKLGLPTLPWQDRGELGSGQVPRRVLLPATEAAGSLEAGSAVTVEAVGTAAPLRFPLEVVGAAPGPVALVPMELAGTLRASTERAVSFDAERDAFLLTKAEFRGFRLYAKRIEDVPGLYRAMQAQDIPVIAQVEEIERIRILDRGLTAVFWLIAVVGIVGAVASLISNLYAAVERKTRDLSMMRLMGLPRGSVFLFPIVQSLVVALACSAVALGAYGTLATVINTVFAEDLAFAGAADQDICALPLSVLAIAVGATVLASAISALGAAWRTTRIEPGEAIRVE